MASAVVLHQQEDSMEGEWVQCLGLLAWRKVKAVSRALFSRCIESVLFFGADSSVLYLRWKIVII